MKPIGRSLAAGLGFGALTFAAAALGAAFTGPAVRDWYPTLIKPAWTPPAGLFGPVWTALYTLMATAAWLVWRRAGWTGARLALRWWVAQLVLNAAWSPLFFGGHRIGLALADLVLLWGAVAATTAAFWRVTPWAGWLMVPYLAWVSFAGLLNLVIWRLNS